MKFTSYMSSSSTEPFFRFMPMLRKRTMQHEKSASKKAHGEPRSSRKAEKPKSEARAGGHVTAWLARFFVLRGSVSPPQLTG